MPPRHGAGSRSSPPATSPYTLVPVPPFAIMVTPASSIRPLTHGSPKFGAVPTLRVYDLEPACVRMDSTTANGHWTVTEDGLFPFGQSTDYRPDLPQVKGMLSALEPLGLPVATDVSPGQQADDPLYVPAIARVREGLG
jgi:hypothetical protein